MEMVESHPQNGSAPKNYRPKLEEDWLKTRPYGTNYKENSSKEDTHDMVIRVDGTASDITSSQGTWGEKCTEKEDGHDVVLSY